jgi:pilus assembly protein Flp/PilA
MLSCFLYVTSFLTDRLRRDERGASLVEYGLLVGLIAVVCVAAIITLGTTISGYFTAINNAL